MTRAPFDLEAYMERPCTCGAPRSEHVHGQMLGRLVVIAPHVDDCTGFMDAIESELGGDPSQNPLLRPLLERSARDAGARLPSPPKTNDA